MALTVSIITRVFRANNPVAIEKRKKSEMLFLDSLFRMRTLFHSEVESFDVIGKNLINKDVDGTFRDRVVGEEGFEHWGYFVIFARCFRQ